jgi:hypothetical protein
LLNDRVVFLGGQVDEETANLIVAQQRHGSSCRVQLVGCTAT